MMKKEIILNNGSIMPIIGIGGWAQKKKDICNALNTGYRMIDTAAQYGNETEVGNAIKESCVKREDIFLTTKLWTRDVREGKVVEAFENSLKNLKTEYVDLYLIHWPAEGFEKAWMEMEKLYLKGRIRSIGVSNFEKHHFEELIEYGASVVPAVNQIESHPFFSNQDIIDYATSRDIVSEAWCPLGGPGSGEMNDMVIKEIASKFNKTPAQIILRWHVQRGVVVIPKSSNEERMKQNLEVFDFELGEDDMRVVGALEKGRRLGAHPDHFDF